MASDYETRETKELLEEINRVKQELKVELEQKIKNLKKEYKDKEKQQINDLRQKRHNLISKSFYEKNYKTEKKTALDTYANELFDKTYKECDVLEQKVVKSKRYKEWRERKKIEKNG